MGVVVGCSLEIVFGLQDTLHIGYLEQSTNLHQAGSEQEYLQTCTASLLVQSTVLHHSGSSGSKKYIMIFNRFYRIGIENFKWG